MKDRDWEITIQRHLDGIASEQETAELSKQLEFDAGTRGLYLEMARIHAALAAEEVDDAIFTEEPDESIGSASKGCAIALSQEGVRSSAGRIATDNKNVFRFTWRTIVSGGIAALLLLGLVLYRQFFSHEPNHSLAKPATLGYASEVAWQGQGPMVGHGLDVGPYTLETGMIRLTMADSSVVTLVGPARFELLDGETIILNSGKLSARVSDPNSRFTVLTEHLHVLDLGTSFGVNVNTDGQTLISVFEGKVKISSRQSSSSPSTAVLLHKGGVVTTDPDDLYALTPIGSDGGLFDAMWPLTTGVEELTHLIRYLPPVPTKALREYQDDTCMFMMPERQSVVLPNALPVNVVPGVSPPPSPPLPRIPAGQRVSSYILFFNAQHRAEGRQHHIQGTVTFSRPILGVITAGRKLAASAEILGIVDLDYTRSDGKRIDGLERNETGPLENRLPRDNIKIDADKRQLYFDLSIGQGFDQLRVIVADR